MKRVLSVLFLSAILMCTHGNVHATSIKVDSIARATNGGWPNSINNFGGVNNSGTTWVAGEGDSSRFYRAFAFFDISGFESEISNSQNITFSFVLDSIRGNPYPLNIDYLGTYSNTSVTSELWSAAPEETFLNVLDQNSLPGNYNIDVSNISDNLLNEQFMVFRLNPTQYDGNWVNKYYNFSTDLNAITLNTAPVPEPGTMLLLGAGFMVLAGFRRKFQK